MRKYRQAVGRVGVALMTVALGVAALAGVGSAATSDDETQGVTAKEVKLGFIAPETGVAGSSSKNSKPGFAACVAAQNAKGGVNGRKIAVEYYDDGQITNLQGVQDLVQNRGVFAVVNDSPFAFQGHQWMLDHGVPEVGGGFDGTAYGQPGGEDLISAFGNLAPIPGITYSGMPEFMKKQGAKNVGAIGYGFSESSSAGLRNFLEIAVPGAGLNGEYLNTSIEFGATDVAPQVLAMKEAGVDAVSLVMVASTNLAIVQTAAQNNLDLKAAILATGYGQDLLDSPIAATLGDGVFFSTSFAPVELKTKATKQFQKDLAKYADFPKTSVPDFGHSTGYVTCKLAMAGLEAAGEDLTRRGFIDATKGLGTFDGAGLYCAPADISAEGFGTSSREFCQWYVGIKDGKFYVANKGKPVNGKVYEETYPESESTTTTTAAASS